MITQMRGNKIYNKGGTITGSSLYLMKLRVLSAGRMIAESHKPKAVLKPSRSIEKRAKLTEKRLSIIC